MERRLDISLGERSYPIIVGEALLVSAGEILSPLLKSRRVLVVTNETVAPLYLESFCTALAVSGFDPHRVVIPDGEEHKTVATVEKILDAALSIPLDRRSSLVALGGGVVGDLTGFAAAICLRGVDFVQVPTTLLAQVDSSVGGKTGVNHPRGKNLIGAFHQPRIVIADVGTLATLSVRDYCSGLAEVVKYGAVLDREFFEWLENSVDSLCRRDPEALGHVVARCCQLKGRVVESDEREEGVRAVLNFGHTVGHGVETLSGYSFTHGEAVSIGMAQAAFIGVSLGITPVSDAERLLSLLRRLNLPTRMPIYDKNRLAEVLTRDKKGCDGGVRFVLMERVGHFRFHTFSSVTEVVDRTSAEFLPGEGPAEEGGERA